ncbi:hypothetical protein RB620_02780 [Paenibacillus sp. LHD-117]|uniref:hypothetical protein n=1 Tax=Paenibacillus sp. LHD-117 TaxID=3071412 RepID=UPI0027DFB191|nr:hypothetical protein [Paenibacillus sp. LHD-117]MDQ6418355.1 hypothetical protein [Paenibacillus sp. LHD-117]
MENEGRQGRMDRLRQPIPWASGGSGGKSGDGRAENGTPERIGPHQVNEEWKKFYEIVKEATEKLRR